MFRKTASMKILSAAHEQVPAIPEGMSRTASARHDFNIEPREGYLYVRSRAISSRVNDNHDGFPAAEIAGEGYKVEGKAYGYQTFMGRPVFVNHYNEDHRRARGMHVGSILHRDVNPDGSPDTWVEVLMEVDAQRYPRLATAIVNGDIDRTSMGVDVAMSKCSACGNEATNPAEFCHHIPAMKGKTFLKKDGSRTLVFEICHGLTFFENSLLVEPPADPTAVVMSDLAYGSGLDHLQSLRPATASQHQLPAVGMATMSANAPQLRHVASKTPSPVRRNDVFQKASSWRLGSFCPRCASSNTLTDGAITECDTCDSLHFQGTRQLLSMGAAIAHPSEHSWFQENPIHADNIVNHWNQATDDEKEQGKRWYADAHLVAKGLSSLHPSKSTHVAAGIIANYSPQQGWAGNMHNAARVLHENKGIGGKGSGMFATAGQAKSADRILKGENYNEVIPSPKINDFAHLIEHGGDADPHRPHVVVDRHALGVAAGKPLTDKQYRTSPVTQYSKRKDGSTNRRFYDHAVGAYHDASHRISQQENEPIAGHQVQATTWLVRQRLNSQRANKPSNPQGQEQKHTQQEQAWSDFAQQHNIEHRGPGTGYTSGRKEAYGEVKAPAEVNTLRREICPMCGESSSAWDGNMCQVCCTGAVPEMFQDPNLDVAREVDLRKDKTLPSDIDQERGIPGAEDVQPDLMCPECESEFEAGEPVTSTTIEPESGGKGLGLAEGDPCPNCEEGLLVSPEELGVDEGGEGGEPAHPAASEIPLDEEQDEDEESNEDEEPQQDEDEDENEDDEEDDSTPPQLRRR